MVRVQYSTLRLKSNGFHFCPEFLASGANYGTICASDMSRILKSLGLFFALVAIGVVSAFAVVMLLLRQEEVRVPDLTGRDLVTALETLYEQGLQLKIDGREPSSEYPRDTVVSQVPSGGSGLKKGRQVRVVVSQGPSELIAPNVTGENFRKADIRLRQAGYLPGEASRVFSDVVERDVVMAQDPAAGSPIAKDGAVGLLVSAGTKPERLIMPRLVGRKAEEALRIVERLGLQHRVATKSTGTAAGGRTSGVVVSQKPGAEWPVTTETTVELVVNR
jgi:eukaryotic-like serine/threonine-protein kinase